MEGDIAEMGKFIGAGLATMGLGGAGIGVGRDLLVPDRASADVRRLIFPA